MKKLRNNQRALLLISGVAALISWPLCGKVVGQSGRRASKTLPTATAPETTVPKPESEVAEPVPLFRELRYPVRLLIAKELTKKHLASEDIIFASFINRLNDFPSLNGTLIGDLTRGQAAKRALSETDAYVVLVQFEIDSVQGKKIIFNSPDLEVKYFVFAPLTSQPQLKGKIYYQSIGGPQGRKSNSPGDPREPPIKITVEAAGLEAAERLYIWLAELVGTRS